MRGRFKFTVGGALAGLFLALPLPLAAQEKDEEPENIEARAGDLRIIHLWSRQPEAFIEAWAGPTPPRLPTSKTMERNQPIQQFILFTNCARDEAGDCHLTATVDISAPDGKPYGEQLAFDAMIGPGNPTTNMISLAPSGIGLVIEDGEQLGRYRVELNVTDENAKQTATSLVYITVVETGALEAKEGSQ